MAEWDGQGDSIPQRDPRTGRAYQVNVLSGQVVESPERKKRVEVVVKEVKKKKEEEEEEKKKKWKQNII